jgi:predicted metal-binding protein
VEARTSSSILCTGASRLSVHLNARYYIGVLTCGRLSTRLSARALSACVARAHVDVFELATHTAAPPACRAAADDEVQSADCPQNVQLKWMAEATSSIYATPIVTDLFADGFKDIIVPSFVHNLEVFQADNGAQAAGFPAWHADRVHSSPLMFDADHDGVQDILLATYSGDILFYRDNGNVLPLKLTVPRLIVKRCAPLEVAPLTGIAGSAAACASATRAQLFAAQFVTKFSSGQFRSA